MKSLPDGGTEGSLPDLESLLAGAYAEFGWDPVTGLPTCETREALKLPETDPQRG
jgi:hypothetical protein